MFRKFVCVLAILLYGQAALAAAVVDPYTFTTHTPILSSQVNSRFSVLYNLVNGNLDNANIDGSANIDPSKLNRTSEYFILRSSGSAAHTAGTTGNTYGKVGTYTDGSLRFGTGSATPDLYLLRDTADYLTIRGALVGKGLKMTTGWWSDLGDTYPRIYIKGESTNTGIYLGGTGTNPPSMVIAPDPGVGVVIRESTSFGTIGGNYLDLHCGTLNLETPLPFAEGGTGGVSGSAGQTIRIAGSGTSLEGYTPSPAFGGGGGQGAVTKGSTSDTITQINASSFNQSASTTWSAASGIVVNCSGAVNYAGTTQIGNLGNGPATAYQGTIAVRMSDGCGNGGHGGGNATNPGGGGGGGFGGAGGNGGDNSNDMYGLGGKAIPFPSYSGGAGGCGGSSGSAALGGAGGARGGKHRICAVGGIVFGGSSTVEAVGQNGGAGASSNAAGGGGGAGGDIGAYSLTSITFSSGCTVRAPGGNGGDAASSTGGVGAGGGGGRIVYMSPSNTVTTAPTAAGGAVGSTGRTTNSSAGSAGVITGITGTPSLPLIAHIERGDGIAWIYHLKPGEAGTPKNFDGREIASFFSAVYAKPGKTRQLNTALLFGDDEQNLKELSVLNCEGLGEDPWLQPKQDIVEGDSTLLPEA